MAFGLVKIAPIDQNPSKAVGVSLPFKANSVFKPTFTTKDAIRNNLINFLLTGPQEKIFNPTFGAGLRKFVFEQITTLGVAEIENYIGSIIEKYFPNIQGTVTIQTSQDYNTIFIQVNYSIVNTGMTDTLEINLNNG
jgi:phage baseplate assembly protein W